MFELFRTDEPGLSLAIVLGVFAIFIDTPISFFFLFKFASIILINVLECGHVFEADDVNVEPEQHNDGDHDNQTHDNERQGSPATEGSIINGGILESSDHDPDALADDIDVVADHDK